MLSEKTLKMIDSLLDAGYKPNDIAAFKVGLSSVKKRSQIRLQNGLKNGLQTDGKDHQQSDSEIENQVAKKVAKKDEKEIFRDGDGNIVPDCPNRPKDRKRIISGVVIDYTSDGCMTEDSDRRLGEMQDRIRMEKIRKQLAG